MSEYLAESYDKALRENDALRAELDRLKEIHATTVDCWNADVSERDSLQKRVTECESVMLHYGMETEHSCMCQFNDDTGELAGECAYHEKIRAERDEAVELLRESRDDVAEASNRTHKPHAVAYYKEQLARIDAFLAKVGDKP